MDYRDQNPIDNLLTLASNISTQFQDLDESQRTLEHHKMNQYYKSITHTGRLTTRKKSSNPPENQNESYIAPSLY